MGYDLISKLKRLACQVAVFSRQTDNLFRACNTSTIIFSIPKFGKADPAHCIVLKSLLPVIKGRRYHSYTYFTSAHPETKNLLLELYIPHNRVSPDHETITGIVMSKSEIVFAISSFTKDKQD